MFVSTTFSDATFGHPAATLAEMSHLEAMLPDGECRAHRRFAELRAEVLSHDAGDSVWRTQALKSRVMLFWRTSPAEKYLFFT